LTSASAKPFNRSEQGAEELSVSISAGFANAQSMMPVPYRLVARRKIWFGLRNGQECLSFNRCLGHCGESAII